MTVEAPLSIEQLIRSRNLTLADMRAQYKHTSYGWDGFYYQSIPLPRPYCIYRKRSNESQVYMTDPTEGIAKSKKKKKKKQK